MEKISKINKRKIFTRIISLALILSSLILFAFGKKNILGFAVAEPAAVVKVNYFVAVLLLVVGVILVLGETLEERANINSYKRGIEKREHIKINYGKAKKLYEEAFAKHQGTIGEGDIKLDVTGKEPLRYIREAETDLRIQRIFEESSKKSYSPQEIRKKVKQIAKEYEIYKKNPVEVAEEIDLIADVYPFDKEHPLIRYKKGVQFTIQSRKANQVIPIQLNNEEKEKELFYALLALAEMKRAKDISPPIRVEAHISEEEATKHHGGKFEDNKKKYATIYKEELERYTRSVYNK